VAPPFAPHTLSDGVFPLGCLAIAFGAKQVRTRELKEPGEFTCSQCGFYIVIPKANWSFSRRAFPRSKYRALSQRIHMLWVPMRMAGATGLDPRPPA
jgi:hypothetical protein